MFFLEEFDAFEELFEGSFEFLVGLIGGREFVESVVYHLLLLLK